jgi:transposase
MDYYAGIDVSLECSSVCVVDASGKIVREDKVASEPEALIGWLGGLGVALTRIGLEVGPLSQWLYAEMKDAGLAVELLETRHLRDAFEAMPVKSDRNDARCAADEAGLVPGGTLQVDGGAGNARANSAQAGAIEASRRRE